MADIFVDQSATFNGDGTTAAQAGSPGGAGAYNTFASVVPSSSDFVWIRRTSTLVALTAGINHSVANVTYVGWPMSGDPDYDTRPASGTSAGWDADVTTHAELICSTVLSVSFAIFSANGVRAERIKWTVNFLYAVQQRGVVDIRANVTLNNCYGVNQSNVGGTITTNALLNTSVAVAKVSNCDFEMSGNCGGTGGISAVRFDAANSDIEFINTHFHLSHASSSNPNMRCVGINTSNTTLRLSFAGCLFTRMGTVQTAVCVDLANGSIDAHITGYDCEIDDRSVSSTASILQTPLASVGVEGSRCILQRWRASRGCKIVISASGQFIHFETFTQTVVSTTYAVIFQAAGSTFVCNNFTEVINNTLGAIDGQKRNTILLQNTHFESAAPFGTQTSMRADVWIADADNTYGQWAYYSALGQVTAESVVRTGGESFALKFNTTSGSQNYLGRLQPMLNGLETVFAELTPVDTKITIYGAYKGYSTPPDASQIWADCDYLDEATGAHRAFADSREDPGTDLVEDSSGWSGDAGVVGFKLELGVAPGQACLAPIRVHSNLRETNAYFYIDPKAVVT